MLTRQHYGNRGLAAVFLALLLALVSVYAYSAFRFGTQLRGTVEVLQQNVLSASPAISSSDGRGSESREDRLLNVTITDYIDDKLMGTWEYDADAWFAGAHKHLMAGRNSKRDNHLQGTTRPHPQYVISRAQRGRDAFNAMLFADSAVVVSAMDCMFGTDPLGQRWQRDKSALRSTGPWTEQILTEQASQAGVFNILWDALAQLRVGSLDISSPAWQKRHNIYTQLYPRGPNVWVRYAQDQDYTIPHHPHATHERTDGYFEMIYNPRDGVIVVTAAWGCRYMWHLETGQQMNREDLPKVAQWSDLAMKGWTRSHLTTTGFGDFATGFLPRIQPPRELDLLKYRGFLNFIVIQGIHSPEDTVQLVLECLFQAGAGEWGYVPDWRNRVTFPVGSWCFDALLASKNNYGIALMLAQWRSDRALGPKVLKTVTVFACENTERPGSLWPCLIWEVVISGEIQYTWVQGIEQTWQRHYDEHGELLTGHYPQLQADGQ